MREVGAGVGAVVGRRERALGTGWGRWAQVLPRPSGRRRCDAQTRVPEGATVYRAELVRRFDAELRPK